MNPIRLQFALSSQSYLYLNVLGERKPQPSRAEPSRRRDSEQHWRSLVAQAVWASTAEGATFSRVGAGEREKCEKKSSLCQSAAFSDGTLGVKEGGKNDGGKRGNSSKVI